MTDKPDHWTEGYRAALHEGKRYPDNPHEGEPGATAWAFGCSEGTKERNRRGFAVILSKLQPTA